MDRIREVNIISDAEDDMARAGSRQVDQTKVSEFVGRLRLSITNAPAFQAALDELRSDEAFAATEVIEIAYRLLGGLRPKSRKSALTAIAQERLRLAHAKTKGDGAKLRVW